jgi:hypothetical protein
MWARRPGVETEETWAEEAETAAAEEVVEDSYPGPSIPSEDDGVHRIHRPTTPAERARAWKNPGTGTWTAW